MNCNRLCGLGGVFPSLLVEWIFVAAAADLGCETVDEATAADGVDRELEADAADLGWETVDEATSADGKLTSLGSGVGAPGGAPW